MLIFITDFSGMLSQMVPGDPSAAKQVMSLVHDELCKLEPRDLEGDRVLSLIHCPYE